MKYPITTATEKLFTQGNNYEQRRFYTTGRCNKCRKDFVDCRCPKINVDWFTAIDGLPITKSNSVQADGVGDIKEGKSNEMPEVDETEYLLSNMANKKRLLDSIKSLK